MINLEHGNLKDSDSVIIPNKVINRRFSTNTWYDNKVTVRRILARKFLSCDVLALLLFCEDRRE